MWFKSVLISAAVFLIAASALGAARMERLDGFRLLDQHGRPSEIAPSGKVTLVYFYRGDW